MEPLYNDYIDEAFHTALLKLKEAVTADRGRDVAVEVIARWAGVKGSAVYAWLERRNTPGDYRTAWRLSVESSREGYAEFVSAMMAATMRVQLVGPVVTDGDLRKEHRQNSIIWGRLLLAETAGNADEIKRLGAELHEVADSVIQEGARLGTGSVIRKVS